MTRAIPITAGQESRWFHHPPAQTAAAPAACASYYFLLAFLLLLYANTPFLLPAMEAVHPALAIGLCALIALFCETVFGMRKFEVAWPEGGFLLAFLTATTLSCLTALWPGHAVESVGILAKMVLVFFFLANSVRSEAQLRGVMWTMVLGGLVPALGTLRHYQSGNLLEGRAAWLGIFANPNEVSYALIILLPLAAYLATRHGWFLRAVLAAIAAMFLAASYVTFSRGGFVGLGVAGAIYIWRKYGLMMRGVMLAVMIGGFVIAAHHWSRAEDFSQLNNDISFQQRIATTEVGLGMFLDHPLVGVGLGCSVIAWPLYAPKGLYTRGALVTHNTIVQVFGETGILGAVPFLFLIAAGIWYARKLAKGEGTKNLGIALEASMWGLVACGMSGGYVLTWFPYLLLGLVAAARRLPASEETT